eukprot:594122-Alexandrium_andersonii.AAC.1
MPAPSPPETGHTPPSSSATTSGPGNAPSLSLASDPASTASPESVASAQQLGARAKAAAFLRDPLGAAPGTP